MSLQNNLYRIVFGYNVADALHIMLGRQIEDIPYPVATWKYRYTYTSSDFIRFGRDIELTTEEELLIRITFPEVELTRYQSHE